MALPSFAIILGLLVDLVCIISVVFIERKRPQATVAWVLVMVLLPGVGVFLYLLIGNNWPKTYTKRIDEKLLKSDSYAKILCNQLKLSKKKNQSFLDEEIVPYSDMITMLLNQTASIYTQDNRLKIFTDAGEKYEDLFIEIEHAQKSINIQYFIIKPDSVGRRLLELLTNAAKRGVEVRLLYDEYGAPQTKIHFFNPLVEAGGKVNRFFGTRFANAIRINHRNHRKIVVIDGRVAYMGGMNIGKEYMGMHKRVRPWRDTHLKLWGSSIYMLQVRFFFDWFFSCNEEIDFNEKEEFNKFFSIVEEKGDIDVQIVSSGPDMGDEYVKYGYMKMINNAKEKIYIQTPYFIPDDAMMQSLKLAANSGVDIRVMIPGVPDKWFIYYITLSYIEDLLKNGIKVYAYNGFMHSKTIVIDSTVSSIGSTNFDMRSFSLNFEINAFIYDRGTGIECERIFFDDIQNCKEITLQEYNRRRLVRRIRERICRLLAPLA